MKLFQIIFITVMSSSVAQASVAEATSSAIKNKADVQMGVFDDEPAFCFAKSPKPCVKIKSHSDEIQLLTADLIKADKIQENKRILREKFNDNVLKYMHRLLKKRVLYARAIIELAPCQGASTIKQYLERELSEQVIQEAKKLAAEFDASVNGFDFNEFIRPIKSILDKDYQIYNGAPPLPLTEYLDSDACKIQ